MSYVELFQRAVLATKAAPYGWEDGDHDGCPSPIIVDGAQILKPSERGALHCCGLTTWIALTVLLELGVKLSADEARTLKRYAYVIDYDARPERLQGIAGGLVALRLAALVPVEEARCGDFCHTQWHADTAPQKGHSLSVTAAVEETPPDGGGRCLWAFSANVSTPKRSPPYAWAHEHLPRRSGAQHDYFRLDKPGRAFHVARLFPEVTGEAP